MDLMALVLPNKKHMVRPKGSKCFEEKHTHISSPKHAQKIKINAPSETMATTPINK
jgi:hypothetical protein